MKLNVIVRGAIGDAVRQALKAKPVVLHADGGEWTAYLIDGEVYTEDEALNKILDQYSWWN